MNIIYRLTILTTVLTTPVNSSATSEPSPTTTSSVPPRVYYTVTALGNSKGAPCVFPFFHNGTEYSECVRFNNSSLWCSTTDNYTRDGQWGECLDYDVCLIHKNLSDPWRNVGFNRTSFSAWPVNDLNLPEGWYQFTGIGGDQMENYCLSNVLSSADVSQYKCDPVTGSVQNLDCGGGLILYYLLPINGTYTTRHSSCNASPCGPNAQCNVSDGSCVCDPDLSAPTGFQTTGGSYTCQKTGQTQDSKVDCSIDYAWDLQNQILNSSAEVIPKDIVMYLDEEMDCMESFADAITDEDDLMSYGESVLAATEKLVAGLVKYTDTIYSTNISFKTLEVQVFVVGLNAPLKKIPRLNTSNAYLDIDLIEISKDNNGFAAVALISYASLPNFLSPGFFSMIGSTVGSVTLLNTSNKQLSKPFNITLKYTTEVDPKADIFCLNWEYSDWVQDSCSIIQTDRNYTVCSCDYPSTVALIIEDAAVVYFTVMPVGLVFLSLTLLTFVLCRRQLTVNNITLVNLCTSLLLTQLLVLIKEGLQGSIRDEEACNVLAGFLHFFFLTSFVWMLIDAVLLFISARNLTKIRSSQKEMLNWKYVMVIGYVIGLVVVGVFAAAVPDGYDDRCWLRVRRGVHWSFYGPVSFILALNMILFIVICIIIVFTLRTLNSDVLQNTRTPADKKLILNILIKTVGQFFILGCPWIVGLIVSRKTEYFSSVILISLQSVFIFLVHCVLNQEVRQQCIRWLRSVCPCKKISTVSEVTEGEATNPTSN